MKIIAYRRVSTDQQAESGLGLDAQLNSCQNYAERNGLTIHATFTDEGISGAAALDERPELMNAISKLQKDDVLLVAKRDRLARDRNAIVMIEMAVKKKKARIISAAGEGTESHEDDPTGFMMRGMTDLFSQFERLLIKSRTKSALQAKKSRGERVGHIPFGYQLAQDGKQLEKNEQEQDILRQMRELHADGLSIRRIAAELNSRLAFNRDDSLWNNASVHRILKAAA